MVEVSGILIAGLAMVGLAISSYFTAVAYRWIEPDVAWVPVFCRLGADSCAAVVFTPRARVFGIPNSVLGQLYYAALLIASPLGLLEVEPWRTGLVVVAVGTVLLGAFLSYSLLYLTRVRCTLCFTSHALNLVLLLLLLARL